MEFKVGDRVIVEPYGMVADIEAFGRSNARVRRVAANPNGKRPFYRFSLSSLRMAA